MQIDLKKPNRFKILLHKIQDTFEKAIFTIIRIMPEKLIPQSFIDWMGKYIEKQIFKKKYQLIRSQWEEIELNKFVEKINQQRILNNK